MRAAPNTPFFWSSEIPFNTQKRESRRTTLLVPQIQQVGLNNKPTVLPNSLKSFAGASIGSSLLSIILREYSTPLKPQAMVWYSLPSGHSFCGTQQKPGQINLPMHLLMDSSNHEIHEGENLFPMFEFHAFNNYHSWE